MTTYLNTSARRQRTGEHTRSNIGVFSSVWPPISVSPSWTYTLSATDTCTETPHDEGKQLIDQKHARARCQCGD